MKIFWSYPQDNNNKNDIQNYKLCGSFVLCKVQMQCWLLVCYPPFMHRVTAVTEGKDICAARRTWMKFWPIPIIVNKHYIITWICVWNVQLLLNNNRTSKFSQMENTRISHKIWPQNYKKRPSIILWHMDKSLEMIVLKTYVLLGLGQIMDIPPGPPQCD